MSKRALRIILIAGLCLAAGPAFGAPLQKSEVNPSADWVAHLDAEAFRSSTLGKLVLAELKNQGLEQKLQDFSNIFSFNPLQDIRDITVYGTGQDRSNAVAVVEGKFDTQKLLSLIRLNSQYQEIPYKGSTLHRWRQEERKDPQAPSDQKGEQMMYGCICEGNRVVVGAGLQAVQRAVDTLKGQATGTPSGLLNQIQPTQGTVFAQVAAAGVGKMAGQNPQAAMLQQTDSLALTLGETADKVFGRLSLKGQTAEVAENTTKMLQGLVAMIQFSANEQPRLAELAKNINISQADKTTEVRIEAPTQAIFQFIKEQWTKQNPTQGQAPATVR